MNWILSLKAIVKDKPLTMGSVDSGSIDREGKPCVKYLPYYHIVDRIDQTQKPCEGSLRLKQEIKSAYLQTLQTLIQQDTYREFLEQVLSDEKTVEELEPELERVQQALQEDGIIIGDIFITALIERQNNLENFGIQLLKF